MNRVSAWTGVLLLPFVIIGGLLAARRDPGEPNWVLPTQMTRSPAAMPQSANPVLPGGATQQPPVAGTLARDEHPWEYPATDAGRRRAGRELKNPLPPTPENLAAGRRAYETFCQVCHGALGAGDGPIIPKFPNPPAFRSKQGMALSDGAMFHTITAGRKKMASHAGLVPWDDRWRIILHIRTLQGGTRHAATR
jgi:hypothetical protein